MRGCRGDQLEAREQRAESSGERSEESGMAENANILRGPSIRTVWMSGGCRGERMLIS